jgi:hypothetical protein
MLLRIRQLTAEDVEVPPFSLVSPERKQRSVIKIYNSKYASVEVVSV